METPFSWRPPPSGTATCPSPSWCPRQSRRTPPRHSNEQERTENRRAARLPDRPSPDRRSGYFRAPGSLHGPRDYRSHEFFKLLLLRQHYIDELPGAAVIADPERSTVAPCAAHVG